MAGCRNVSPSRHRWLVRFALIGGIASIAAGLTLWHAVEMHSLAQVAERVEEAKPLAGGVRLALIGMLALLWPHLVAWTARGTGREGAARHWQALRWRVAGWLLVIELVLGQELLARLLGA